MSTPDNISLTQNAQRERSSTESTRSTAEPTFAQVPNENSRGDKKKDDEGIKFV